MAHGNQGNTEIRNNGYTDFLGPAESTEIRRYGTTDIRTFRSHRKHGKHRKI